MRRKRQRQGQTETKVWHDPNISPGRRRKNDASDVEKPPEEEDAKPRRRLAPAKRTGAVIAKARATTDPVELDRLRLLSRMLAAEGRPAISKATEEYFSAGHELPSGDQALCLQLLEHRDEERIRDAIDRLGTILKEEEPQRRMVLESRLRRIEEFADEVPTQESAARLRRTLSGT